MDGSSARRAQEQLLEHAGWMRRLALSLASGADAEDCLQETWRVALEKPPLANSTASLRAWLASVLRNAVRMNRRSKSIRERHEELAAKSSSVELETGERTELQRRIAAAVDALAEPYRSAIVLRYFDELAPREIAERQDISYDAARQRLSRGLSMLRADLDRDYDGGRDAWSAVCIAVAARGKSIAAASAAATGGTIMGMKSISALAAAIAIAVVSWWWVASSSTNVEPERSAVAPASTLELARSDAGAAKPIATSADTARAAAKSDDRDAPTREIDREHDLFGVVLDPNGAPVAGAELDVAHGALDDSSTLDAADASDRPTVAEGRSDAKGEFSFALERGRSYELRVRAAGFAHTSVEHCQAGERVTVRLGRAATVRGRVVRKADGSPVASTPVELLHVARRDLRNNIDVEVATSDADGGFVFEGIAAGRYYLEPRPEREAWPDWIEIAVDEGATVTKEIAVDAGRVVRGRVLDAQTKQPIADAEIGETWNFVHMVRTDSRGEFTFEGFLIDSNANISARARGYSPAEVRVGDRAHPPKEPLEILLPPAKIAVGRIVDAEGKPIEGAYVAAPAVATDPIANIARVDWPRTRSLADGTFRLDGLRSELHHELFVRRDGFGTASFAFPAREADELRIDFGDVHLASGARVEGLLVDDRGAPLADRVVELSGWNTDHLALGGSTSPEVAYYVNTRASRSDDLGRFSFADVAPGEYDVRVAQPQIDDGRREHVIVRAGEAPTPIRIVLARGRPIRGRVVGPNGEALRAWVQIDSVDGDAHGWTEAGDDGRFQFDDLADASFELDVRPFERMDARGDELHFAHEHLTDVKPGDDELVVRLQAADRWTLQVVDADGKPVEHAKIELRVHGEAESFCAADTDASGRAATWIRSGRVFDVIVLGVGSGAAAGANPTELARRENLAADGRELVIHLP